MGRYEIFHTYAQFGEGAATRRARKVGFVNCCRTAGRDALASEEAFEEDGRDVALLEVRVVEDAFV